MTPPRMLPVRNNGPIQLCGRAAVRRPVAEANRCCSSKLSAHVIDRTGGDRTRGTACPAHSRGGSREHHKPHTGSSGRQTGPTRRHARVEGNGGGLDRAPGHAGRLLVADQHRDQRCMGRVGRRDLRPGQPAHRRKPVHRRPAVRPRKRAEPAHPVRPVDRHLRVPARRGPPWLARRHLPAVWADRRDHDQRRLRSGSAGPDRLRRSDRPRPRHPALAGS